MKKNIDEMNKFIEEIDKRKEMEAYFYKRTKRHIDLVLKYCKKINDRYGDFGGIIERGIDHDGSKYSKEEKEPYIWITWRYKCKDDGVDFDMPDGMEERMHNATKIHVLSNRHHPEYFGGDKSDEIINKENRDGIPKNIIDATKMNDIDIAEMVADWCAMSEERWNTPMEWADKTIGKRWKFNDRQKKLIYDLFDKVWERKKQ